VFRSRRVLFKNPPVFLQEKKKNTQSFSFLKRKWEFCGGAEGKEEMREVHERKATILGLGERKGG